MVLEERAADLFDGPLPSPYMLFTHRVRPEWLDRIPAVVHVDGTARIQTVAPDREPLVARMLQAFERRTGVPVVVNTSLNTAGRPMVDDPRDALECFGSAPVDALAIGPFVVRRPVAERHLADAARLAA
jgi:carbamoyltransferase